jgi:hypothetical protein
MIDEKKLEPRERSLYRNVFLARVRDGASVEAADRQAIHSVTIWQKRGAFNEDPPAAPFGEGEIREVFAEVRRVLLDRHPEAYEDITDALDAKYNIRETVRLDELRMAHDGTIWLVIGLDAEARRVVLKRNGIAVECPLDEVVTWKRVTPAETSKSAEQAARVIREAGAETPRSTPAPKARQALVVGERRHGPDGRVWRIDAIDPHVGHVRLSFMEALRTDLVREVETWPIAS